MKRVFARMPLRKEKQSSIQSLPVKLQLRRRAMDFVGGPERASVLDLFAGDGAMYRAVWSQAADYHGCDNEEWYRDGRKVWICDNLRLLRAIDLSPFNVYDLDAYGQPWDQLYLLAARRRLDPGERAVIVCTIGMRHAMINKIPHGRKKEGSRVPGRLKPSIALLAQIRRDNVGSFESADALIARAARGTAERMSARLVSLEAAQPKQGSAMVYVNMRLEGV